MRTPRPTARIARPCLRLLLVLALASPACGGIGFLPGDGGTDGGDDGGLDGGDSVATWTKPEGYASVTFFVDDTANRTYRNGELFWMGTFIYDPQSNVIRYDANWGVGPDSYPALYDDGPISEGGHEMPGASALDHIFSTEVYVLADPQSDTLYTYGAINAEDDWIWQGDNGHFSVPAGSTGRIQAPGTFLPAFGTYDLKLVLDTHGLSPGFPVDGSVAIRGSMLSWGERELYDDGDFEQDGDEVAGDGRYTYLHSANLGSHDGLLSGEQRVQFVFLINDREYRTGGALPSGLSAWTNCNGSFEPAPIFMEPDPRSDLRDPTVTICESAGRLPVGPLVPPLGPAAGGSMVSIYGDGFADGAEVLFGSRPAQEVVFVAPGQINCRTPASEPGPVTVRVGNPDGEFGELAEGFEYVQRLGPEVRHVEPARGPTAGSTEVTVSGVRFANGAEVRFGGSPAEGVEVLGPRRLRCLSPAQAAGTVSVSVVNPDGSSASLPGAFEYSDQPDQRVDWAALWGPAATILYAGESSEPIAARVFEPELTPAPGCDPQILAELGWGPEDSDPLDAAGTWTFVPAACREDCPACLAADEYQAALQPDQPGRLAYAFRFSRDGGQHWTLADLGLGSRDGYDPARAGLLTVLADGELPVIRSVEPAAGSVLGGWPLAVDGDGFAQGLALWLDGEPLGLELVEPQRLEASVPPHPAGPATLTLVPADPDGQPLELPGAVQYVLQASPQIDGTIGSEPGAEWDPAYLAASNESPSDWGPNGLEALWVAFDQDNLYLALAGWVDPAAGNALVVFLDTDYGAGSGLRAADALIDETGAGETAGLDAAISNRITVDDPGFGAEFAAGTVGLASVTADEVEPGVLALAGLRSLADTAELGWLPATIQCDSTEPGQGTVEMALPWTSLYSGGLPPEGARLALFARVVAGDGEYLANACLPPDDPDAPGHVSEVFVFEAR